MDKEKIIRLVYYSIVVVLLVIAMAKIVSFSETQLQFDKGEISESAYDKIASKAVNMSIMIAIVFIAIAAGAWFLTATFNMVIDIKRSIFALIGAAILIGIFGICYGLSEPTWLREFEEEGLTASTSLAAGAGILTSIVLVVIAIVVWFANGVKSLVD